MASQWYYQRQTQVFGPVSDQQLKHLADSGQLQPSDKVQRSGSNQWVAAERLKGLFAIPVAQPIAASTITSEFPPPLPPDEHDTRLEVENLVATTFPSPAGDSTLPQNKGKQLLGSLASRGKAAGLLIAKQSERTKLLNLTLPHLYQALGKQLYSNRQYAEEFASNYQAIDALATQIKTLETNSANESKAEGIAGKAKAAAKSAQVAVQVKTVKLKLGHALGELGKAGFEQRGEVSGPGEFVCPIVDAKLRADQLAVEMAQLSKAPAGQILTPKRIAIGGVVLVCLILLGIIGKLGSDDTKSHSSDSPNPAPPNPGTQVSSPGKTESHGDSGGAVNSSDYQSAYRQGTNMARQVVNAYRRLAAVGKRSYKLQTILPTLLQYKHDFDHQSKLKSDGIGLTRNLDIAKGRYEGYRDTVAESGILDE